MNICITTKACSFDNTIVEKIEVKHKFEIIIKSIRSSLEWYNEI